MKYFKYWVCLPLLWAIVSCSKMDDIYYDYVKNGPVVYPGKPDTVMAYAGRKRIRLRWVLKNDRNVTSCKVFWNLGFDSLTIPVTRTNRLDTISVVVNNLIEGAHTFTVYTYDDKGNKSVGTERIGYAFDSIYQSTLTNRAARQVTRDVANSRINIVWVGNETGCIGTEWQYTAKDQTASRYFSPVDTLSVINSCDVGKPVSYRTLFIPEANAVDTFYTEYKNL